MDDLRAPVRRLVELGAFPRESDELPDEALEEYETRVLALDSICPLTGAEARALLPLLGRDGFWGLAWSVLHAIETAGAVEYEALLPPAGAPLPEDGEDWPALLRLRIENARRSGLADVKEKVPANAAIVERSMRVTKVSTVRPCAICERTLLMGERAMRFSPDGHDYVDVCPLCQDTALEYGWVREGAPMTPTVANDPRKRRSLLTALFEPRRPVSVPVAAEPILRRLSEPELAVVEAADLFNASTYRRTVEGIAKSLGEPQASIVPLSGVNAEMVVTIAWDLSWYQYRISLDAQQPVRLESRGYEIDELEQPYREWNARLGDDGRVVPDIARV